MKARRVILIEEMFRDICTPEEQRKVNELYRVNNKGSAVVFMLKRIRAKWNELLKHNTLMEGTSAFYNPLDNPRIVKFNYKGTSTFESI